MERTGSRLVGLVAALAMLASRGVAQGVGGDCSSLGFPPVETMTNLAGVCSGNGICANGECVCDPGWTGRSDIINMEGLDCQISTTLVNVLWGLMLLVHAVILVQSVPRLRARYAGFQEQKELRRRAGKSYGVRHNRGVVSCLLYFGVAFPCSVLYALLRIARPDQRLGIDAAPTVLFCLAKLSFYSAVYAFQPALLASTLKSYRKTRHLVRLSDRLSLILCAMAVFFGAAPIAPLITGTDVGAANLAAWFVLMGGTALQLVFFGLQAWYIKKKVVKILTRSYKVSQSEVVLETRDALARMQQSVVRQSFLQFFVYAVFAFFPFMFGKHDYFVPLGWLGWGLLGKSLAFTAIADRSSSRSAGSGSSQPADTDDESGPSFASSFKDEESFAEPQQIAAAAPALPDI